MKTKLIFLAVLFACQNALTMVAAQEPNHVAPVQQQPANDVLTKFQQKGLTFVFLNRSVQSQYWLPENCIQCIGEHLKKLMKLRCSECNFGTWQSSAFYEHVKKYIPVCPVCKARFKNTPEVWEHLDNIHNIDQYGEYRFDHCVAAGNVHEG